MTEQFRESIPMHPDDYTAHLAWITAKRFHELVLKETFRRKIHRVPGLSDNGFRESCEGQKTGVSVK